MKKFLQVLVYEYKSQVFQWQFLLNLLSLPLLVLLVGSIVYLSLFPEINPGPIGVVDLAGVISNHDENNASASSGQPDARIIPFPSEAQAKHALDDGEIQAYYLLEEDYLQTSHARLVAHKWVNATSHAFFLERVRDSLLADLPEPIKRRITEHNTIVLQTPDGSEKIQMRDLPRLFLPAAMGFFLMFATFFSSGYLMHAIIEERSNRTLEILISSISPTQLMAGKTLGLVGVALTQYAFWGLPFIPPILFAFARVKTIFDLSISWKSLTLPILAFFPAFIVVASCMTTLGALAGDHRQGELLASLFALPTYIPIILFDTILKNPESTLAIGLSFFPFTAPVALGLRIAVTDITPLLQGINLASLVLMALASLWLAGYAWRLGSLNMGNPFSLRHIFRLRKRERGSHV